jgi:hypothetical protein
MKRTAILLLSALLCSTSALARELPRLYQGIRPLGMGGAFTAVADDGNALFYNPAGLDKVPRWGMGVINPFGDGSKNWKGLYEDAKEADFDVTSDVIELLREHIGEDFHIRTGLFPHFYARHLALGVLGQAEVDSRINNPAFPEFVADAFGNVTGLLGGGFGFYDGKLRVGATPKYVKGYRLQQTYDAGDIADPNFEDRVKDDLVDGAGFGFDLGAMVEAPWMLKPTFALTIQNIGDVDLGDAGIIPQQIHMGLSLTHSFSWLTLIGAADWRDVTNNAKPIDPETKEEVDETDLYKRLHFGLEARLPKFLALRAGLYQGYATFGGTLDLWILKLDAATYAEELGAHAGQRADRRYAAQVTLGW